jgi:MOSC domain-containing protein YiiM
MNPSEPTATVIAVSRSAQPGIPKYPVEAIELVAGLGVSGDYHAGELIRHRYLARKNPSAPNHRHVLLVDTSIHADLRARGIVIGPGAMGENLLLDGIEVMRLPLGARVRMGDALVEITELRNPCAQLNDSAAGLFEAVLGQPGVRPHNAGMFARIVTGGVVRAGDEARVEG